LAVTRGQFETFVRETNHAIGDTCSTYDFDSWVERPGHSFRNPGFPQDGTHPVVCVSWGDAKAFVAWLSNKTDKPYRLLSEAEREYVTRAGTTTPFWWGSSISTTQANYNGNYAYGGGSKGEWRKRTVPVDRFRPNVWGLYNVHGNVWDWVEDCWHDNYEGAPTDGSAWTTGDCGRRVLRGGSWSLGPRSLRAAWRIKDASDGRYDFSGFRLARTLDP